MCTLLLLKPYFSKLKGFKKKKKRFFFIKVVNTILFFHKFSRFYKLKRNFLNLIEFPQFINFYLKLKSLIYWLRLKIFRKTTKKAQKIKIILENLIRALFLPKPYFSKLKDYKTTEKIEIL